MIITTTPSIEGRKIFEYKGIDLDYEMIGGAMLMVSASKTAVVLQ